MNNKENQKAKGVSKNVFGNIIDKEYFDLLFGKKNNEVQYEKHLE